MINHLALGEFALVADLFSLNALGWPASPGDLGSELRELRLWYPG